MSILRKIVEYFNGLWYDLNIKEANRKRESDSMESKLEIERDIIKNSYYVINYFKEHGESITNLKLQKLMYFLEGLYMVITDEDYLYTDNFFAWTFGPVCKKLYDYYKNFDSNEILLDDTEKSIVKTMPNVNRIFIESLFKIFGKWSAYELVELTHQKNSPWSMVYVKDDESDDNIIVSKLETKKWLKEKFKFEE